MSLIYHIFNTHDVFQCGYTVNLINYKNSIVFHLCNIYPDDRNVPVEKLNHEPVILTFYLPQKLYDVFGSLFSIAIVN